MDNDEEKEDDSDWADSTHNNSIMSDDGESGM
jgi:hypothetical protein